MTTGYGQNNHYTGAAPNGWNGIDASLLYQPITGHRDGTQRIMVNHHGSNSGAYSASDSGGTGFGLLQKICDLLQTPILCPDGGSDGTTARPNAWGNGAAVNAYDAAYTWSIGAATGYYDDINPGAKGPCLLLGGSMGGYSGLNWAARNTAKVKAILLIAPAVDADYIYTNGSAGRKTEMDNAYGAIPPTAAPTIGGTAGGTTYNYKTVIRYNLPGGGTIDSIPSTASTNFSGPAQANLGSTPNTVTFGATPIGANNPLLGTQATVVVLRSVSAGAYTNIGNVAYGTTSFSDNVTGGGAAYTVTPATAWSWNGSNYPAGANTGPSWSPTKNLPAGLKAIPCLYCYSTGDGTANESTSPGVMPAVVNTFKTAYGANCTTQELFGAPTHTATITTAGLDPDWSLIKAFLVANL